MSESPSNDSSTEIDERAPSQNPHDMMPENLFPMVIKDGVIELNRQQVCLSSFPYDSHLTILRFPQILSRFADQFTVPPSVINRFEKFHTPNTRDDGTNKLADGNYACSHAQQLKAVAAMGFGLVRHGEEACTNCQNDKSHFEECREFRSLSRSCSGCLWRGDMTLVDVLSVRIPPS